MNKAELIERIANGENSRVEFKRDDCRPGELATEMAALLNLEGGVILLGVEDDGRISGLTRSRGDAEEWVMNIARQNLQPATIPVWTCIETESRQEGGSHRTCRGQSGKTVQGKTRQCLGDVHPGREHLPGGGT